MYPTKTDNIVAYAKGPTGPEGGIAQSVIDDLIGGAPSDGNTLKKLYDSKAPLDGATLTNATTTTQAPGNNSTKLATTAFVHEEVTNAISERMVGAVTMDDEQTLTNKTLTSPVVNSPTGIVVEDLGDDAWSAWTPTFTMATVGGTPITAAVAGNGARYKKIGKTVFWSLDVVISGVGDGNSGRFIFSNPVPALNNDVVYGGGGLEVAKTNKQILVANNSSTEQTIAMADGTLVLGGGDGTRFQAYGFYEAA